MSPSTYFLDLHSAYQSELDDLASDSEGRNVLNQRLGDKRRELGFLLKMMEISAEMVVVVLHRACRFSHPGEMEYVLTCEADDLPEWDSIRDGIEIAAWAGDMVQTILREPMGEWFMTIASALEYMQHRPLTAAESAQRAALDDEDQDLDAVRNERHDDNHTEDHDEDEAEARAREEAGNDWMVEQGFDRKE